MIIELGKGTKNAKEFASWLKSQGYEVDPPKTDRTYIDGDDILRNIEARQTFNDLLKRFAKINI